MATATRSRPPKPAAPSIHGQVTIVSSNLTTVVPPDAYTMAGFRQWATRADFPPGVRVTYDQGAIGLDMSNEELQTHNKVKCEILRVFLNLNRQEDLGELYGDGALVTHVQAEVSNNPDGVFVSWSTLDAGRVQLVPREGQAGQFIEVEGTPDWVLEVVSLSSVHKDTKQLRDAYHRAGIPEYWLVDARGESLSFQILHRRNKGYVAAPVRDGWQRSRVFGREFRLERTLGRRGLPRYTLHVREE